MGPPPEAAVAELQSMGFPKDQVIRALQAAFHNLERATEYLLDGNIPSPPDEPMVPPQAPQPANMGAWPDGMLGQQLLTKSGTQPTAQALGNAQVVLLYFSAHWCPPCQRFTPMLTQAYAAANMGGQPQVQVVFASSDRDPASFEHYYAIMPWLALPFGPQAQMLGSAFGVQGIPSLVAIDRRTGNVLDKNARDMITRCNFDLSACCRNWGITAAPPAAAPAVIPTPAPAATLAAPVPAKKPEPAPTDIDSEAVNAALMSLSDVEDDSVKEVFCVTILKVLNNTLQTPQEPKFRTLKKENAALKSKLFDVADGAAAALLKTAGFTNSADVISLGDPPTGQCTAVRDRVQQFAEEEKMRLLRKERDARIAEEQEKDKGKAPERKFGGGEDGRHNIGAGRRRGGGGG